MLIWNLIQHPSVFEKSNNVATDINFFFLSDFAWFFNLSKYILSDIAAFVPTKVGFQYKK